MRLAVTVYPHSGSVNHVPVGIRLDNMDPFWSHNEIQELVEDLIAVHGCSIARQPDEGEQDLVLKFPKEDIVDNCRENAQERFRNLVNGDTQ